MKVDGDRQSGLFVAIVKSTMADIKPGMFVGSTGVTQPDGSQKAIEVHIFPESMRGTGEGHYDWDLKPNTKMTNANVEQTVAGVDGPDAVRQIQGWREEGAGNPGDRGCHLRRRRQGATSSRGSRFSSAPRKKQPDGTVQTPRITYGKDGLTPPM